MRQLLQRFGYAPLIAVQVGQEDRRLRRQVIGHDGALADFQVQGLLDQGGFEGLAAAGAGFIRLLHRQ